MKKTAKSILLVAVMAIILLALTGCGSKKLVATKSSDEAGIGKYEEKIEVTFKDDKADKIVWTMEFEDEEKAESLAKVFESLGSEMEGFEFEHKGKKVILSMDSKAFADQQDLDDNSMSREELKKELEEEGYKVK